MVWRAMIVLSCLVLGWSGWSDAAESVLLDVRTEPTGGVRATATILFPVEPAIIRRILIDYAHWPELFEVQMRMAEFVTDLKGGDFKQYHRVWKLIPVDNEIHTKAEFHLVVEVDTIAPDWIVAIAMRRELDKHFQIIKEKALAQQELQPGLSQ
jgi:hypothetical protein